MEKVGSKTGIIFFRFTPDVQKALDIIRQWNQAGDRQLWIPAEADTADCEEGLIRVDRNQLKTCDLFISIGGDGTFLSAARLAVGRETPILGVHTGSVGFLTDCRVEELASVLEKMNHQAPDLTPRSMLSVQIKRNGEEISNDILLDELQINPPISSHRIGQMVDLAVSINDKHLTDFSADFLLVTTPTGSTGYNLSAGGPVVHPQCKALVIQAVNSPTLTVRPLVLPDDVTIRIQSNDAKAYTLLLDGRKTYHAEAGDEIIIKKSLRVTQFVNIHYTFLHALKEKLGWSVKVRPH